MKFVLFFTFAIWANSLYSQGFEKFFTHKCNTDSNVLSVSVKNTNFVKNNEYFNDFNEGYTIFGYFIKPELIYKPFNKVSFTQGLFLQSYFGEKQLTKLRPVFSINFQANKNLKIIFGDIKGTVYHNLPEPVFDPELYLTENTENGLQILYSKKYLKTDFWINWEQFIFTDSNFPEIFTAGLSNIIKLTENESMHNFSIKLSGIVTHTGGQIGHRDVPVETITNSVSGFDYSLTTNTKLLKNIKLFSYYIGSFDTSPEKNLPYLSGFGILSGINFSNNIIDLELQHWYSDYYFSEKGNEIFQSISHIYTNYYEDQRALILTKMFFNKNIYKFLKIGIGADTYYDFYNQTFDFTFGFYIKTYLNFILKSNQIIK